MTAIITPPDAPTVPPYPALGSSTFNQEAYDYGSAMPAVSAGLGALADNTYNNAVATSERAVIADGAAAAAVAAAASAINAPGTSATSTTSLALSTGPKSWTIQTGKLFPPGQPVYLARQADPAQQMFGILLTHDNTTGACTANMKPVDGASGTHTDWIMGIGVAAPTSSAPALVTREQRSTVTALDSNDNGKVIGITAAIAQTIAAQAGLPDGWHVELRNEFNGDFTIDPNGSELIDGQATVTVKAGYALELNWKSGVMRTKVVKVRPPMGWAQLALITSNSSETIGPDTYVRREYAVGAGSAGGASSRGAGAGMAYGDLPVKPGDTLTRAISSGVATVAVNGVTMLTANPASGATAGTASKHASVTNGGAYSGGAGAAAAGSGASSGSPLGGGIAGLSSTVGGSGWGGGSTTNGGGGGTASAGVTGKGGTAVSAAAPSAEPLLALLNGAPGQGSFASGSDYPGGDGGPGAGGGNNQGGSAKAGKGGIGAGGGGGGNTGGDGGFGGGGGAGGTTGGAGGYGAGGASPNGPAGAAAFLYFKEA